MFPYMVAKPGPTMYERIRRVLRAAGPRGVLSRATITSDVLGQNMTLKQANEVNECINDLIGWKEIVETKNQIPGTGHEGPPVFEYRYAMASAKEKK